MHVVAQSNPFPRAPNQRIYELQTLLQGKDIVNAVRERPNLSIGVGTEARLSGYLIAFQGEVKGTEGGAVVIADAGTIPKGAYAEGALLRSFTDLYRVNYADKGSLPPVIIEKTDPQSVALFAKAAQRMATSLGVSCTTERVAAGMKVTFSRLDAANPG